VEKRPPYLIRTVSRHGRVCFYVWKRPGPKIRIHGEYGSRAFMAAYRKALYEGIGAPETADDEPETLARLIAAYRRSPAWMGLAKATRRGRGNMLDRIIAKAGDMPAVEVDRAMVAAGRDAMSGPGAGKTFIDTLRGLYRWALETGHADDDPTAGVKRPDTSSEGHETWTEADVAAYESHWPVGTRERLWLGVLLYTGLRRSDAVRLSADNILGGTIETVTGKTGTPVVIPLHPELKSILDASPLGKRSLVGMHVDTFAKRFRKACLAAGVNKSPHGLRKAAAVKLAEAGASVLELNAFLGWTGSREALRYTAKADRARLARQAAERLNVFPPPKR
jgi:integrase